jgi:hypothetical protein
MLELWEIDRRVFQFIVPHLGFTRPYDGYGAQFLYFCVIFVQKKTHNPVSYGKVGIEFE